MKVKDLIYFLEGFRDEEEIYFLPNNSCYPEDFSENFRRGVEIRSFWGDNFKGTVLISDGQVGGC